MSSITWDGNKRKPTQTNAIWTILVLLQKTLLMGDSNSSQQLNLSVN